MGLLPFFNAIGKTEDIGVEIFHYIEEHHEDHEPFKEEIAHSSGWLVDNVGIGLVLPNANDAHFEMGADAATPVSAEEALDRYIVFLAETFTDFEAEGGDGHGPAEVTPEMLTAAVAALNADPDAPKLLPATEKHAVPSAALGDDLVVSGIDFPGQKLALIPLFRSVYSDVNNTIALALISFVMVEFWGLRTLGFSYLGKFFNFSGFIPFFVGILELLSEFIRIVSFAFRLFGNIFAGEVLILMLTFLLPFLIVDIIYGLELFVGFIQAAVFALLTLVFAVMAATTTWNPRGPRGSSSAPSNTAPRGGGEEKHGRNHQSWEYSTFSSCSRLMPTAPRPSALASPWASAPLAPPSASACSWDARWRPSAAIPRPALRSRRT